MKLIRTVDAAGQVLCHDITQIIPGEYKDARFRKGHVIQPEDIPVLLSIGKENLYVWEKHPGILHEDEAAALLYKAAAGKNIHGTAPKEGKIELIADCDGLLKINRKALMAVNSTPQMMIATIHGDLPVKKGQKLAGTRIIPLVIEQEKMDAMQAAAGAEPILNVLPMQAKKVGIITTGSEVFKGRIEDKFNALIDSYFEKLKVSRNDIALIHFKNKVDQLAAEGNKQKFYAEMDFVRRKIDEITREVQRLKNNIEFFSSASSDNPLVREVNRNIERKSQALEQWKEKLAYMRQIQL